MDKRIIKFRVWDTYNLLMVFDPFRFRENTDSPAEDERFNSPWQYAGDWQDDDDGVWRPCQVMQFTGMHDKNGKEIYEGDILEIETANHTRIRMICKWGTVQRTMDSGWEVDITGFHFYRTDGFAAFPITKNWAGKPDLEMLEIIGNIYENPELIK